MIVKNKTQLESVSKVQNIPFNFNLYTRRGKCETTLEMVAYISTMTSTKFKYEFKASYPYTLTGEPGKYEAIDFSEGPNLQKGSFIGNLKIVNINPPFITLEKVF